MAALCTSCHSGISSADPSAANVILSVITAACSKKQKKFQDAALCALEQVTHELLFLQYLFCAFLKIQKRMKNLWVVWTVNLDFYEIVVGKNICLRGNHVVNVSVGCDTI